MILLESLQVENFKSLRHLNLCFPRQGSVLIEGLNEAGKSTLFESIYFALYGKPLECNLDECLRYGADSTLVRLGLEVDGTRLEVQRTLRRNRASTAGLIVRRPGAEPETIQAVRAVNTRIVEELGKLDGDALLNSCFVEQKKLSKLEDLGPEKRRESLLRLLNLEKLGNMEDVFKVTRADEQALTLATRRRDLAEMQQKLPSLERERAKVERLLQALGVRRDLEALANLCSALIEMRTEAVRLRSVRHDVDGQLQLVGRLRQAALSAQRIIARYEALAPEERRRDQLKSAIAELDSKEREELPARERRHTELLSLVGELERLAADRQRIDELVGELSALAALKEARARLRAEQGRLEGDCRQRGGEARQIEVVLSRLADDGRVLLPRLEEAWQAVEKLSRQLEAFLTRQTETQTGLAAEARRQGLLRLAIDALNRKEVEDLPAAESRHSGLLALVQRLEHCEGRARRQEQIAVQRRELVVLADSRAHLRAEQTRLAADRSQREDEERQLAATLEQLLEEERVRLPELQAEQQDLGGLIDRLESLQASQRHQAEGIRDLEHLRERLAEVIRLQERLSGLEAESRAAESALEATRAQAADLQRLGRRFQIADALREWVRVRRTTDALAAGDADFQHGEARANDLRRAFARMNEEHKAAHLRFMLLGLLAIITAAGAVAAALSNLFVPGVPPALALVTLALGFFTWRARSAATRLKQEASAAEAEAERQEQFVSRRLAEREAIQRLGGGAADLADSEGQLALLEQAVPADAEAGEARLAELSSELAGQARTDTLAAGREIGRHLAEQDAEQRSRLASVEELRRQQAAVEPVRLQEVLAAKTDELTKLAAHIQGEQETLGQSLEAHGLVADVGAVRLAREGVLRDVASLQARLGKRSDIERQLATARDQIRMWSARLGEIDANLGQYNDEALADQDGTLLAEEQALGAEIAQQQAGLTELAGGWGIAAQSGAAQELAGRAASEIAALRQEVAGRTTAEEDLSASLRLAGVSRAQLEAEESQLREALEGRGLALDSQEVRQALSESNRALAEVRQRLARRPELDGQLANVRAQIEAWDARLSQIAADLGRHQDDCLAAQAQTHRQEKAELEADCGRRRAALAPILACLDLAEDVGAARELAGRVASEIAGLQREIAGRPGLVKDLNASESAIVEHHRLIESEIVALTGQSLDGLVAPAGGGEARYRAFLEEATNRRETLDEPRLRLELTRLDGELGRTHERDQAMAEQQSALEMRLRATLAVLGGDSQTPLDLATVESACPVVLQAGESSESTLKALSEDLLGEIGTVRLRQTELQRLLGPVGPTLDLEECREDERRQARAIEVKRRALRIVTGARTQMVAKVLPNTERNLRFLLPLLTADRYHDARITDDYRIEVWDETANGYVAKSIFSGGTRDQFSLALRLAFALATLPQELGTTPGFVFLDEPLSSFDSQRAQALVDLLTRGHIAANFMQIFVIAHSRSFDRAAFPYHLRLEGGQVVESDLPHPAVTA